MPDDDSELMDFEDDSGGVSLNILEILWYWAPAALFGCSVIFALITVILNPLQRRVQRKPPLDYFNPAVAILDDLNKNENVYSNTQKLVELTKARVNLNRLAKHYRKTSEFQNGKYFNPYLLIAETNKRLAEISIPSRRKVIYSDALTNYSLAFDLEQKERDEDDTKSWNRQFFLQSRDNMFDSVNAKVRDVRKMRRMRYILYNLGLINLSLERTIASSRLFSRLKEDFFREEMDNLRLERSGMQRSYLSSQILPAAYELLPGDKVKLHYYLAQIAYLNNNLSLAEKEYKVFLLKVGRSRERFISKMRLGEFAFKRGKRFIMDAEIVADKRRLELKNNAIFEFKNSADIYSEIVEESAPEDLLREAYFKGGIANLEYAAAMDVGRETSWDYMDREFEVLKSYLEDFSGMKLPERSLNLPEMLAESIMSDSLSIPGLSSDVPSLVTGTMLSVVTEKRITPIEERDMRLAKARSYFDAASSGSKGRYLAESRVLIGRSLIVEQSSDKARRILKHAMEAYPYQHIKTAALLGIGWTYLAENSLDKAWKTYQKLPAADELPKSPLYSAKDINRNITDLARQYVRRADDLAYPENWLDSPPGSEKMVRAIDNSRELHRSLLQAASAYELLLGKYRSKDIAIKVSTAAIYSRLADLLLKRPFGSEKDQKKARQYKINAADTYMRIAEEHPASLYDNDALLRAGQLFYDSKAYERCCESFELFSSRYGLSDQIGRVRNLLGLAYQNLGLFEKSEKVLRTNAQNSTTAEGRKSLYYLGKTYLLRSDFEADKKHLGGPGSDLLLSSRDDQSVKVSALFYLRDITDWNKLLAKIKADSNSYSAAPGKRIKELFAPELSSLINDVDPRDTVSEDLKIWLLRELNGVLTRTDLYSEAAWRGVPLSDEVLELLRRDSSDMGPSETMRLNRLLLDAAFPKQLVPTKMRNKIDIIPRTAREVFEYVRRQPGLGPSSLPWRWSTFSLGESLFIIAQEEKFKTKDKKDPELSETESLQTSDDIIRNNYQRAMDILIEGLNRYVLYPQHPEGVKIEDDPKGYAEIKMSRFKSLYYLGLCYKEIKNAPALQRSLSKMIDMDIYGPEIWQNDKYLSRIYKNAYFYLGQSYYENGRFEEAYDVYEAANDKLKANISPYFIYMMGESLFAMGKKRLARSKYIQARHAVRSFGKVEEGRQDQLLGVEYWQKLNEQRIKDLEYLEKVKGENR
ncbi:MAG: tetratricopeptide repeat protein [Planctomycetota bacterium]|jgi:TolA-binding protein